MNKWMKESKASDAYLKILSQKFQVAKEWLQPINKHDPQQL